ncbi:ATP-binding protein [Sphingomonas sp. BIUV-7]|uniref:histidine kinase n=1 Tax=Sphingomonas natans TaxID=3063330 RepID=A0ABT8Y9R8_9SPHN|nr:ATP-binding protein [Sphingomonas sp. BIUV-7]MDO6415086.1 ATP-binding protein [Sphingomonas sp. BIUV-7]
MARWPELIGRRRAARNESADALPPGAAASDAAVLLDVFPEPLLLLDGVIVLVANDAARQLFGAYLDGEDVRLAIRHPQATALLSGTREGPVAIGGLGNPDRRWEMAVTTLADGRRLVRLEDRSSAQAGERMRTDFVANASHELRTPLSALIGFIETLEDANGADEGPIRARFLGIMGTEARRMQHLIDDLMSLSRIEADRFVAPRDAIDLAALARIACAEIEGGGKAGGRIRCTLEAPQAMVHGDRAQLLQLLHNVIGNALKYGRPGSEVAVSVATADGNVIVAVRDEGEGIPAELIPRLTERFYRVDPGRSRSLGGTGLGLAIVKHVVERHRGRLDITSVVGTGTTLTVTLPLALIP